VCIVSMASSYDAYELWQVMQGSNSPQSEWMVAIGDRERQLLEKLAAEGKATRLLAEDMQLAKWLGKDSFVFLVRATPDQGAASVIITPKGRHILANPEQPKKFGKPPFGFLE
jgi:hypothetical protein